MEEILQQLRSLLAAREERISSDEARFDSEENVRLKRRFFPYKPTPESEAAARFVQGLDELVRRQLTAAVKAAKHGDSLLDTFQFVLADDYVLATATPAELDAGLELVGLASLELGVTWPIVGAQADEATTNEAPAEL